MALTTAQLNAHLRAMLQNELERPRTRDDYAARLFMIRAAIAHIRLGDADSIEAGNTVARFVCQQTYGRTPTADDLHMMRGHWATDADETAGGLLE